MGRNAIAEQITQILPEWKHLALEVIQNAMPDEAKEARDQHVEIVRRCAVELEQDGMHLILSMPESKEHLKLLRDGLAPNCVTVHLGTENDTSGNYDYTFDSSVTSMKDIVTFLQHLIRDIDAAA